MLKSFFRSKVHKMCNKYLNFILKICLMSNKYLLIMAIYLWLPLRSYVFHYLQVLTERLDRVHRAVAQLTTIVDASICGMYCTRFSFHNAPHKITSMARQSFS